MISSENHKNIIYERKSFKLFVIMCIITKIILECEIIKKKQSRICSLSSVNRLICASFHLSIEELSILS